MVGGVAGECDGGWVGWRVCEMVGGVAGECDGGWVGWRVCEMVGGVAGECDGGWVGWRVGGMASDGYLLGCCTAAVTRSRSDLQR